jgi:hypothetical protein
MKKYNLPSSSVDKPIELKDGRKLHSTHNNFKRWLTDPKGKVLQIDEAYYNKAKKLGV